MPTNVKDNITNKQLMDELIKLKQVLRNAIEASETRLLLKLETLNCRVKELEQDNAYLKNKVEQLDRKDKRNNIVIFGLDCGTEISIQNVCEKLNQHLNLNLTSNDFNDVFPLGRSEKKPIKIVLTSFQKKRVILQNSNKLKGTDIFIRNDLTEQQREEGKVLRRHLKIARENSAAKSFIKGDRLYIGNKSYTVQQLSEDEDANEVFGKEGPSSAPPGTPVNVCLNEEHRSRASHKETQELREEGFEPEKETFAGTPKGAPVITRSRANTHTHKQSKKSK